jgi:hypothetical protein
MRLSDQRQSNLHLFTQEREKERIDIEKEGKTDRIEKEKERKERKGGR